MDSSEFEAFLRRLADNDSSLTKVELGGTDGCTLQTDEDARRLESALAENMTVTKVSAYFHYVSSDRWAALANAIQKCRTIESVTLCCCRVGDEGARSFAALLSNKTCRLKYLNLTGNRIGRVGLDCLATALAGNASLQYLNLTCNNIDDEDSVEAINKILTSNCSLQSLWLHGNLALAHKKHHDQLMNGIRQRCRQATNTLRLVRVDNPQLQRQIDNYLKWSRLGRRLLSTESNETTPVALWVHYIAKVSSESNLIYDLVRAKPDLFKRNAQMAQKRSLPIQNSAEETTEPVHPHDEHCSKRRHLG